MPRAINDWPEWRNACVIHARTIAENLRMIEFAVEGGLDRFGSDARTRVRGIDGAAFAGGSHVCINVGEGRMRVLVGAHDTPATRFMWSLIPGARVRLTVPAPTGASPALRFKAACVRLTASACGQVQKSAADHDRRTHRAANTNAPPRQHLSL